MPMRRSGVGLSRPNPMLGCFCFCYRQMLLLPYSMLRGLASARIGSESPRRMAKASAQGKAAMQSANRSNGSVHIAPSNRGYYALLPVFWIV